MIATIETTQIFEDELVGKPTPHILATGKNVVIFNLRLTPKTLVLKTGNKFVFENDIYEIMNTTQVQSKNDYIKFNCIHKPSENKF